MSYDVVKLNKYRGERMKQLLTTDDLIKHMRIKGIKFNIVNTEQAYEFLTSNNYYFKLASYRSLYSKIPCGRNAGKYQNLEFAYLKELSTLDMHIRYIIVRMCLDIEHAIKVMFVNSVSQNQHEDGYDIVRKYLGKEDAQFYILKSIKQHKSGEYCKSLIAKYYPIFPIWVLVEVISFGDLLRLIHFYEKEYKCMIIPKNKLMNVVRDLRNASAHSNCLLNNLNQRMSDQQQTDIQITRFVQQLNVVKSHSRRNNLRKVFVYDFVVLLYVYDYLVSDAVKEARLRELIAFMNGRAVKHKTYFEKNSIISSAYIFLNQVVDKLYSPYYPNISIEK